MPPSNKYIFYWYLVLVLLYENTLKIQKKKSTFEFQKLRYLLGFSSVLFSQNKANCGLFVIKGRKYPGALKVWMSITWPTGACTDRGCWMDLTPLPDASLAQGYSKGRYSGGNGNKPVLHDCIFFFFMLGYITEKLILEGYLVMILCLVC